MKSNEPHTSDFGGKVEAAGIAGEVARFGRFLKGRGFRVFQSSVLDAIRSVERIGVSDRKDFFHVLRANLVSTDLEWGQFEGLFDAFWRSHDSEEMPPERKTDASGGKVQEPQSDISEPLEVEVKETAGVGDIKERQRLEGVAYCPISRVERKDLSRFDKADIQVAQLALKQLISPFRVQFSRRRKRSHLPGAIDFPRSMRKSLRADGIPLELFYKEKKKRLKRLIVLADVSGSMDRYARFVMPFLLGLRGIGSRAEVFVFSTSLTPVTSFIRHVNIENALDHIAREVPEWSGGTRIGHSLHQFNERYGQRLLNRRSVVVVLSDGWDLGARELLRREMNVLSEKAYCVIWLNPLADEPGFQPVCQGMRAALPYVDHFLPANSLRSLQRVGRLLSRIMVH
jgi:uncharacterized protein with von Willebrand factor type A (vWA) domain